MGSNDDVMATSAERQMMGFLRGIDRAVKKFERQDSIKVLRKGANIVRKDARTNTPVRGSDPNKTSLNPRYLYRGKRAKRSPKGEGKIVAYYVPGNLQKSIQTLTFRGSDSVYVGPKFARKRRPIHGRTVSSADGYYAAALYGSAARFRERVLEPALRSNAKQVLDIIEKEAATKIPQYL